MKNCKLCGNLFDENKLTEEHYPAKSVGNYDIVKLNMVEVIDHMTVHEDTIVKRTKTGENIEDIMYEYLYSSAAESIYPKGRTTKSLCVDCNTFLGKYDEAYLKFFNNNGEPKIIKGFTQNTKLEIIKAIFGKFLSVPEANNEKFDFIDFLLNKDLKEYNGEWRLYFIKRDHSTDLFFRDIQTSRMVFDEGIIYELTDEKFIFNLMNFDRHEDFEMNNIFDILNKNYKLVIGAGEHGGYHAQALMANLFRDMINENDNL